LHGIYKHSIDFAFLAALRFRRCASGKTSAPAEHVGNPFTKSNAKEEEEKVDHHDTGVNSAKYIDLEVPWRSQILAQILFLQTTSGIQSNDSISRKRLVGYLVILLTRKKKQVRLTMLDLCYSMLALADKDKHYVGIGTIGYRQKRT
jgi:hypothetical protein